MSKKIVIGAVAIVLVTIAVWLLTREEEEPFRPVELSEIDDPAQLDELHLELADLDPSSWITRYRPGRASSGYNLVLYRRRVPMIIDMNGNIVHVWPRVRAIGRARLLRDGRLAVIGTDNLVKEYDWDGNLTWFFQLPRKRDFPHHDLRKLDNGNYLILASDITTAGDYVWEVTEQKEIVWEWWSLDHLEAFPNWDLESRDPIHSNSIQVLPPNQWFEAGDERFRPGNILVSGRNLDTIFIIDKLTGEVVWTYTDGLDRQHEALMVGEDLLDAGSILVFNNGLEDRFFYRRSAVQAIDPVAAEVVWEYRAENFFSSVAGTAQRLPGETTLISSSQGGRVFEITADGRFVWEWVPPFKPMRVERLPYDHCPQLAALERAPETRVRPRNRRPFVDSDLYRFEFVPRTEKRQIEGRERYLLRSLDECRELLMPVGPSLRIEFGFDKNLLEGHDLSARFQITVATDEQPRVILLDESVNSDDRTLWNRRSLDLEQYELQRLTMCLSASVEGSEERSEQAAAWALPSIHSRHERLTQVDRRRRITDQERRVREQNLKALGYVE
ncbi:MAG: aryl-sulfate sulfotransferase [Thermoanaerobaculales bacterium]|nr:aryl-sulfate sulfotransferase [Thermoanaerobaculales bacterium]